MSLNKKKRRFGATFRNVLDVKDTEDECSVGNNKNTGISIIVRHIPNLPEAEATLSILNRIVSEFGEIIRQRGWNVQSINEMCCCHGDGYYGPDNRKKRKKRRVMPSNVLGYNLTSFSGVRRCHSIHLRLRRPRSHALLSYDDVAATMSHELAHCVVGPHNAKFYKLMDEIQEQHAIFLVKGQVLDKQGFPLKGGQRLGHANHQARPQGSHHTNHQANHQARNAREKAREAAEARRNAQHLQSGLTTYCPTNRPSDPRQAALKAAERRLQDSNYCLPCNDVICILQDSSDEEEEEIHSKHQNHTTPNASNPVAAKHFTTYPIHTKPKTKPRKDNQTIQQQQQNDAKSVIDLTLTPCSRNDDDITTWTCQLCTLINTSSDSTCKACNASRNVSHSKHSDNATCSQCTSVIGSKQQSCANCTKKQRPIIILED